jgi:hypothetical protein
MHNGVEMWHRARLLVEACRCLRLIPKPIESLRVLDVGCGIARSSRLFGRFWASPPKTFGNRSSGIGDRSRPAKESSDPIPAHR